MNPSTERLMDPATPPGHAPAPRAYTGAASHEEREAALYAEVAARLRAVCAAMPPGDFDRLVRDICATKRRWESEHYPG